MIIIFSSKKSGDPRTLVVLRDTYQQRRYAAMWLIDILTAIMSAKLLLPSNFRSSKLKMILVPLIIIIFVLVIYYKPPHSGSVLTGYDNIEWFKGAMERETIKDFFGYNFSSDRSNTMKIYNPGQYLIWRVMANNFDDLAYPYQILVVIIHLLNVLLVYLFAQAIIKNKLFSMAAAMSFASFYPTFRTVNWVGGGITTALAVLFILLVFLFQVNYFRTKNKLNYILALIIFLIGLFTKEYVIFVIPIIAVHYILFHRQKIFVPIKKDLVILPYLITSIPILFITVARMGDSSLVNSWGGFNFSFHMLFRFFDYLTFLSTVVPISINSKIIAAVIIAFCIPVIIYFGRKDKNLLFVIFSLFLFISVFIYQNFRDIYDLSRYLYLPSIPWFILLYYLASKLKRGRWKTLTVLFLVNYTITLNIILIKMHT